MDPGLDQLGTKFVSPLSHPALQSAYSKISGKQVSHTKIYLNCTIIQDFTWLMQTIEASDGIHIMDAEEWDKSQANLTK